jgi:TPR repeat protein
VRTTCRALILLFMIVAWAMPGTAAEKRVALVIGSGKYSNFPALPNPPNDARLVSSALEKLAFDVQTVVDPDYEAMKNALRDFGRRLDGATVALFYYAGHGLQISGRNYLLPINATLARETDLRYEAFDVQAVLEQMDQPGRVNLVFLDACRDNPLARTLAFAGRSSSFFRGLAPIETSASGTLIAFATAPGEVSLDGKGRNSPFTEALVNHIATPDLDIRQMLTRVRVDVQTATGGRQRPWVNESLDNDFYFVPRSVPAETTSKGSVADSPAEIVFWQSIATSRNAADYQAYLQQFPHGAFAPLAHLRLNELSISPRTEPAPVADPDQARVREALTTLGFRPPATGDLTASVRLWQAFAAEDDTGHLTVPQRDTLFGQATRLTALLAVPDSSPRGTPAAMVNGGSARFAKGAQFETGAVKDSQEAAYWYALAAQDHSPSALTNLGTLRARARPPDFEAAHLLWLAAAALGEPTALFNLGALAERGLGEPADPRRARGWYARAAARNNAPGIAALKRLGD